MDSSRGIVLFGDVVASRHGSGASARWLGTLRRRLDVTYGPQRMATFEYTQGDEIQGLLDQAADPFQAVLESTLLPHAGSDAVPRMRWAAVFGAVEPGRGPATHRTGDAFLHARALLEQARDERDGLLCRTGDASADAYLAGTTPLVAAIIDRMTDRQRHIARLALIDGLRQSEIAARLDVSRPTVSISAARADVRNLARLVEATRRMWTDGVGRILDEAGETPRTDMPA